MAKRKPDSTDAYLAELRAKGVEFTEGKTVAFPEIVAETTNTAISPGVHNAHPAVCDSGRVCVVHTPPSVNGLFRTGNGKNGQPMRFKSREYKAWVKANGWKLATLGVVRDYPVAVILTVECKLRVGRDLDNLNKAVLDTMKSVGVLVDDDWRYVSSVLVRYRPCDGVGVRVTITKENA